MTDRRTRTRPKISRLISEAMVGVVQRSSRSTMTIVGIALGVASFVADLGITTSANAQIGSDFLRLQSRQISVEPQRAPAGQSSAFPSDADQRVAAIDGVEAVGRWWTVPVGGFGRVLPSMADDSGWLPQVVAATPGYWDAVDPELSVGRVFNDALAGEPVAVVGERVAEALGITSLEFQPTVYLDGQPLLIIGVVTDTAGSSAAINSVVVPAEYARAHFTPPGQRESMIVLTRVGAAAVVADQIAPTLDPTRADAFRVLAPPGPSLVRDRVTSSTQTLFYVLAAISVLVSGVGIANVSLIGVLARTREIGLRRSLGALPRHIAFQFMLESTVRGLLGGLIGTTVALVTVTVVSLTQQWTAVIEPWSLVVGPAMGLLIGSLAGVYPAIRATRVQPVEAFRA